MITAMRRLKAWVRVWLGLDALATVQHIKALEAHAKQRHEELRVEFQALTTHARDRQADIVSYLDRIEKRMIAAHVDSPREFTPPVLDWDTVQALALHQLEKEPQ